LRSIRSKLARSFLIFRPSDTIRAPKPLLISGRPRQMPARQHLPARYADVYDAYATALAQATLDEHPRRAYASRVHGFLACLEDAAPAGVDPLTEAHGRDFAARDYRSCLKTVLKRTPATANAHLVA